MAVQPISERLVAGRPIGLVSCLSFEDRSLRVASELSEHGLSRWVCLLHEDIEIDAGYQRDKASALAKQCGARFSIHELSKKQPLRLADTIVTILDDIETDSGLRWFVDISTMTHEMLLVFVAALDERGLDSIDITVVYNIADRYSDNEKENRRKWVSRGIQGVRSVVGYAGMPVPGESATLVALPGFDLERVSRIVEELEPERLLVGIGTPNFKEHTWMYDHNYAVAKALLSSRSGKVFEYQSLKPEGAALSVFQAVAAEKGNIIFTPLNSKVSTFAVGLLCRLIPAWQVCYAPALVYNVHYSTPSDRFFIFEYTKLKDIIGQILALTATTDQGV